MHEQESNYDILWCFHEADAESVRARNEHVLDRMQNAISRGRFRGYFGVDCHTIFDEICDEMSRVAAPPPRAAAPLTNWHYIDAAYLDASGPLSEAEVLRYFDGAVPAWRYAISGGIPKRAIVLRLMSELNQYRDSPSCSLHVILGAGGEGKSTVLRQVAADLARTDGWRILWRPEPAICLVSDEVQRLDPSVHWLLVADDAENLVENAFDAAGRLHEAGRSNIHLLFAARQPEWQAAGTLGTHGLILDGKTPCSSVDWNDLMRQSLSRLGAAEARLAWENLLIYPARNRA